MFDNPNKELQRLQDQLLAAEKKRPAKKVTPRKVPAKKAAPKPKKEKPAPSEPKNKPHSNSLWIALMLELLALAGVLIWWLLWN